MVRPATGADAATIRQHLRDFLGAEHVQNLTLPKVRNRLRDPNIATYINPSGYCEVKLYPLEQQVRVTSLLPRGVPIVRLKPNLSRCLKEVMRRKPLAGSWRVWAFFWGGVDADGNYDAGESECRAWQPQWPGSVVRDEGGQWIIEARMEQVT